MRKGIGFGTKIRIPLFIPDFRFSSAVSSSYASETAIQCGTAWDFLFILNIIIIYYLSAMVSSANNFGRSIGT